MAPSVQRFILQYQEVVDNLFQLIFRFCLLIDFLFFSFLFCILIFALNEIDLNACLDNYCLDNLV